MKKEKKFTFRGVISVYATDIDDAFRKIGNYYSALSKDKADEIEKNVAPTIVKMGIVDTQTIIKDLQDIIKIL